MTYVENLALKELVRMMIPHMPQGFKDELEARSDDLSKFFDEEVQRTFHYDESMQMVEEHESKWIVVPKFERKERVGADEGLN